MTVKGIAEAVGRDETNVQRWIKKILTGKMPVRNNVHRQNAGVDLQNAVVHTQNAAVHRQNVGVTVGLIESIRLKAGSKDPHRPADYTFEEAVLIIEVGLGKSAAGVYRVAATREAELQNTLAVKSSVSDRLDRIEKVIALLVERVPDQKPLQITAPENQKVLDFIENHVVYTRLDTDLVKQCSVWDLYKYVTANPGKKSDFIDRFCRILRQEPDFKYKNIRAFWGMYLKDCRGVCTVGWD